MIRIAIDGPSGAGKSSVAKIVAKKLGCIYVDTGAMYRAVALYLYRRGIDPDEKDKVIAALPEVRIGLSYEEDGTQHVLLCEEDVSREIRENHVSMLASRASAIPEVRAHLLELQRDMARRHSVVMDGRDIGTVILPDAEVKIFLSASAHIRAVRRAAELKEKGTPISVEQLEAEIEARDENDRTRSASPCVPAEDAVSLDNSDLTLEQTADAILRIAEERIK